MRFFFYGTLIAGSGNAAARTVHARLQPVSEATVRGALWAIPDGDGWYPALLRGEGAVHGILYEAGEGFGADDLARLDDWEDFNPALPGDSLYIREDMAVLAGSESCSAMVYRYNRPLPGPARPIARGDFPAWLAAHDYRAFGE